MTNIAIYTSRGNRIETVIDSVLDSDPDETIHSAITCPATPHWCWIGDVLCFTQAISAIEVLADDDERKDQ